LSASLNGKMPSSLNGSLIKILKTMQILLFLQSHIFSLIFATILLAPL